MIYKPDIKIAVKCDNDIERWIISRHLSEQRFPLVPFPSEAPLKRKMIKEGGLTESIAKMASFLLDPFLYLLTDMI